jgi:3-oxoacyl-[acyl-carrier-protein] synthase-3
MLKFIAKRAGISMDKIPINIEKYGNTNGSTIPLLLVDLASAEGKGIGGREIIMVGFGAGLSWGGIATKIENLEYANIVRV